MFGSARSEIIQVLNNQTLPNQQKNKTQTYQYDQKFPQP